MNYKEAMQALDAGKKLNRKAWGSKIICKQLTRVDIIPWRKASAIMEALVEEGGPNPVVLDSVWLFDISGRRIEPRWHPTAEDMEGDDWETVFVKPKQCRVCGKRFDYGDEQSPVLKDNVWNRVLREYGFQEKQPISREHPRDDTGFICYECMENGLERKIMREDLQDVPFNGPFNEFYFKEERKRYLIDYLKEAFPDHIISFMVSGDLEYDDVEILADGHCSGVWSYERVMYSEPGYRDFKQDLEFLKDEVAALLRRWRNRKVKTDNK